MDRALQPYLDSVEEITWTALLLDPEWCIQWVSDELRNFLGVDRQADVGVGMHVGAALLRKPWITTVHPDSVPSFIDTLGPFIAWNLRRRQTDPVEIVGAESAAMLDGIQPAEPPQSWSMSFRYVPPDGRDDGYIVDILFLRLFDGTRELGYLALFDIGIPPRLVAMLARGDQRMYERMARLVVPGHREAAILFCDLHGSGAVSRRLPTAEYFDLVRRLWVAVDGTVAESCGIVGKHAGDGATAFFLAEDLGGRSAATRAALLTARTIHQLAEKVFADVTDQGCLMKVGLHWGTNLYMGQLVPGGRLDVTALGDEVNETSRIEQAAGPHQTLASKQLLEGLSAEHAHELGLHTQRLSYRTLAEIVPHDEKVVRDAGTLAVAAV